MAYAHGISVVTIIVLSLKLKARLDQDLKVCWVLVLFSIGCIRKMCTCIRRYCYSAMLSTRYHLNRVHSKTCTYISWYYNSAMMSTRYHPNRVHSKIMYLYPSSGQMVSFLVIGVWASLKQRRTDLISQSMDGPRRQTRHRWKCYHLMILGIG